MLVIDAIGELTTTSIWTNNRKRWSQWYPKSLGLFYSAMTDKVGLKPLEDEYILMGMAAYGDPDVLYSKIRNLYDSGFNFHKGCDLQLNTQSGFDIAAATQKIYEEEFRKLLEKVPANDNLVLGGGCVLNCVANKIALEYFNNVWIFQPYIWS